MVGAKCDNCGEIWEHWHEGWTLMPDENSLWDELDSDGWIQGDMIDNVVLPPKNLYCKDCYIVDENDNTLIKENIKN